MLDGKARKVVRYLADGVSECEGRESMWYVDDVEHLMGSSIHEVFECVRVGDRVRLAMRYLRDTVNAGNGYDAKLLVETGIIDYILPFISVQYNLSLVEDALCLAIEAAKCEIPPGTSFENGALYEELDGINHECPQQRALSLRLLCLLLEDSCLKSVVFRAMFSEGFVQDLASWGIFENYDLETRGVDIEKRLKTLKYAFRYVRLMAEGMSADAMECYFPMIPASIEWLKLAFQNKKEKNVQLFGSAKIELLRFITVVIANPQNRSRFVDGGLIELLVNTIHKHSKDSRIVAACFDCITQLCREDGRIYPQLQTDGFLYLIRGTMQDVDAEGVKHILGTLEVILPLMPCDMLWTVELVDDVFELLEKGTYTEKDMVVNFLLDFFLLADYKIELKMLQKGFLETMCDTMATLDDSRKIHFLDVCARVMEGDQETRQFVESSEVVIRYMCEVVAAGDEPVSTAVRSFCESYGLPPTS